jgi:hypothetical protein
VKNIVPSSSIATSQGFSKPVRTASWVMVGTTALLWPWCPALADVAKIATADTIRARYLLIIYFLQY